MGEHRSKRGLDLPLSGAPSPAIDEAPASVRVALVVGDYVHFKPRQLVQEGEAVRLGQPVLECRDSGVRLGAPAGGIIDRIHRGERRRLESLIVRVDEQDLERSVELDDRLISDRSAEDVRAQMIKAGLWSALRVRPFGRIPAADAAPPAAIFVTAIDTHPLAPSPSVVAAGRDEELEIGLTAIAKLSTGPTYFCQARGDTFATGQAPVKVEAFVGPHPAGCVGLHIHRLEPVSRGKRVWHVGLQDVLAIGRLFLRHELDPTRVVSLAGPSVRNPRHVRTRLGAEIAPLVEGALHEGMEHRVLSGSVLDGRKCDAEPLGFLGRYHRSITVLPEGRHRELLGWIAPGAHRFSIVPTFLSNLLPKPKYQFTTSTHGSSRAIVPIGSYERVMPMDVLATPLGRALLSVDVELAEELGCLELEEEDVALMSVVCPGKNEFGPALRKILDQIESSL